MNGIGGRVGDRTLCYNIDEVCWSDICLYTHTHTHERTHTHVYIYMCACVCIREQIYQNLLIHVIKSVVVVGRNEAIFSEMNFLKVIFYERDCVISED
jgi:hypothetical protein